MTDSGYFFVLILSQKVYIIVLKRGGVFIIITKFLGGFWFGGIVWGNYILIMGVVLEKKRSRSGGPPWGRAGVYNVIVIIVCGGLFSHYSQSFWALWRLVMWGRGSSFHHVIVGSPSASSYPALHQTFSRQKYFLYLANYFSS